MRDFYIKRRNISQNLMIIKNRIIGLNRLLSAIHESDDMRISIFLSKIGLDKKSIDILRKNKINELACGIILIFKHRIFQTDARLFSLIMRRYGLDGDPPESLRKIGESLEISHERVRQLELMALKLCRSEQCLKILKETLKSLALGILKEKGFENPRGLLAKSPSEYSLKSMKNEKAFTFDIQKTGENRNVIVIRPLKPTDKNDAITVTEKNIESFHAEFMRTVKKIGWHDKLKLKSISDIKKKYVRAYEKWTVEEDEILKNGFPEGLGVSELSSILQRQPSAIISRLPRLGLKSNG